MKKVMIVGPKFYDYYLSIERGFKNLGFSTSAICYYDAEVSTLGEKASYLFSTSRKNFFDKKRDQFNNDVLKLYITFQPDLVFIIQAMELYKDTVEKMTGCKKVLWMMDSIFRIERGYALRKSVDEIFVFEKTDIPKLWEEDKIKAHFLPLALDEKVYFPIDAKKEIDLLFVGALYENRLRLLENICDRFKEYNIKIYGWYYSPFRRPYYHLFRKHKKAFLNKNISPRKVNELYSRSKICLNIHHTQNRYGVNQRFFEISGSRSFQLVDQNEYISDNFTEKEILMYKSEGELVEKIEAALTGKIDIALQAQRAYTKILSEHTFTHRMQEMLDNITVQQPANVERKPVV